MHIIQRLTVTWLRLRLARARSTLNHQNVCKHCFGVVSCQKPARTTELMIDPISPAYQDNYMRHTMWCPGPKGRYPFVGVTTISCFVPSPSLPRIHLNTSKTSASG